MRFGVLGPLEVHTAGGRLVPVGEPKVRALLAVLLADAGHVVTSDRLLDDLWGDNLPARPSAALQTKVWHLRRALEAAEPGGRSLIVSRAPGYLLDVPPEAVDAHRFAALAAEARASSDPDTRVALLTDALALWRGPAYADFADAEFARTAARPLDELRLVVHEELAEARLDIGEHDVLAGELGAAVAAHPLRERLHAAHMLALYRAGRQHEAVAAYHRLRTRLAEELGVDPGSRTARLYQAILEQDPALEAPRRGPDTPGPAGAGAGAYPGPRSRGNLPAALGDLVGRSSDVAAVRGLLAGGPDTARLLTLTGPGGVGKTRLALEAAARSAGAFPDGVWFVELSGLDRSARTGTAVPVSSIVHTVAAAIGVRDDTASGRGGTAAFAMPVDRLAEALGDKRMLLVLDNCEHVVEPVAELAALLLARAPRLVVLATSQESLGIAGEVLHAVGPLGLPDAADDGPEALLRAPAVRLFVARAAAAAPGFVLDAGNTRAVAAICRRLDGLPLALELAATRVRLLGVRDLAARLDDRFRLLGAGRRGAPARQQTLRSMIDWSWELLGDAERVVLRRLATQAEGCTLAAAERVCGGPGVPEGEVLDVLARLVDRSLVVVGETALGVRYRMLESVAAYCLERLREAGDADAVWRRHALHYAELAESAAPLLRTGAQRAWLECLDAETANLRNALDAATRYGDAATALRLANALGWYWFLRGRLGEAARSYDAALAVPGGEAGPRAVAVVWQAAFALHSGASGPARMPGGLRAVEDIADPLERAYALWLLAFTLYGSGDLDHNHTYAVRALAVFEERQDRWGAAAARLLLAGHAFIRGDFAESAEQAAHSLAVFRELGDRWGQLRVGETLAMLAEIREDYDGAAREHRGGLRMAEELGLWTDASYKWSGLGRLALLGQDYELAREYHERGRRLAVEHSHKRGEQFAEIGLALAARRAGDLDTAEALLRRWIDWLRRVYGDLGIALVLAELGFIAELRGELASAYELHLQGYEAARSTGDPRAVALALEGLAATLSRGGRPADAARLLGAAAAARESVGVPLPKAESGDVDRATADARSVLGEERFGAEHTRGRALAPEALVGAIRAGTDPD